jgi:3-oxoacyl-[acyl-carrier-protein] synthase II
MLTGSVGAFLVLESVASAVARGAAVLAHLGPVAAAASPRRHSGAVAASLIACARQVLSGTPDLVVSAATGCSRPTQEEATALAALAPGSRCIATGDAIGHAVEAAFPASVALAAAFVSAGDAARVLVTGAGHHRGEGATLVSAP